MTLNNDISKKISRWLSYFLLLLVIIFIVALLAVRFILFPNIDAYKNDIAAYASKIAQQKIRSEERRVGKECA